jgi:outer membrane lipoprotein-sorting protein
MSRAALALVLALAALPRGAAAAEPARTAREILDAVDDLFRSRSSHGRATMTVTTAHWTRSLTLEFWTRGKEHSLIRILAPQKEKGTATLKAGNDLWNYLPKVKRVIKLPSSMLSASWMGSHFTNDDLVKESRMAEDYTFSITFEGERDGGRVVEVTCIPRPEAAVVWGKVVVRVRHPDHLPLAVAFHAEDGTLARTITYGDIRRLGGRELPTTLTVVPADAPAESTVVTYDEIEFDVPLDDDLFSLRSLQR